MNHESLIEGLKKLRLHAMVEEYSAIALTFEKERKSFEQYLAKLVEIETEHKRQSKISRLIKQADLPKGKILETYDYSKREGINAKQINRLAEGHFLKDATNIVFYGTFGVGKSHLAEGLVRALCEKGYRCLFVTVSKLINELQAAHQSLSLASMLKRLDQYDLLAIDELGYSPHTKEGADLFFQLISQRYERRSVLITTNLTYSEWDQVFINKTTTAAAIDRIIHKCETFNIIGPSKRAEDARIKMEIAKKSRQNP
jgi:DNA replication protein DnaC